MKKQFSIALCVISTLVSLNVVAQVSDQPVLMIVGNRPVTLQEFKAMYYKNLSKDSVKSKKALDNYMLLFTDFRLKVNAAIDARLDTTPSFKQEMGEYRQKLADPYMRNQTVEDNLVKEAYDRMQTDIKAAHILIKVGPDDSPADTLAAYNKILQIRNEIVKKKLFKKRLPFDQAAKEYSQDDRTAQRGGEIGYITSLETYYPFENALYASKVGDVSLPIRTSLGYHLIKVLDVRPDPGQIEVEHIMIRTNAKMTPPDSLKAIAKIDSIYGMAKQGKNFEEMAKKLSQDPSTGRKGGILPWFGVGRMPPGFEQAAFGLKNIGDVSAPVRSPYGWHVIKLIGRRGPAAFNDSVKESISSRVLHDNRSELAIDALVKEVKDKYHFKEDPAAKAEFYAVVDESIYSGKWSADKAAKLNKTLFTLDGATVSQQEFAQYIVHNQLVGVKNNGGEFAVNKLYPKFVKDRCLKFKNDMLEREYPQFAEMLTEYRDGILLFDVTDKMVWTKALKDTAGLRAYYAGHNGNYMWGERADATIFTCSDDRVAMEVKKLIKDKKTDKEILAAVNAKNPDAVSVQSNMYDKKDNAMVDANWKEGISENQAVNGKMVFVNVRKIVPPAPKNLDDVRGMVTTDYQSYLMTQWLNELKAKYPVSVNQQVLSQVIAQ